MTPLYLKEASWLELIGDPVMAAEIIMNCNLDVHQAARLRYFWFCPNLMDDSGVGTGKTTITFIWQALRHILLPHPRGTQTRLIALFYPTLSTASEAIGDQFEKFIENAALFRHEVAATTRGGKRYAIRKEEGYHEFRYRNGGITRMPAIGMTKDGSNLASRRYTDGVVDEQKEVDLKSRVLDKQILQRCNAPTPYSKKHPLWTNHVKLLGHAEDPGTHPAWKRNRAWTKIVKEGSQEYHIITSSFRDTNHATHAHLINQTEIRRDFHSLTASEFAQRRGGIWQGDSEQWYVAEKINACASIIAQPLDTRPPNLATALMAMGKDVAKGRGVKSDLNAACLWLAHPLDPEQIRSLDGVYLDRWERPWHIRPTFGVSSKGQEATDLSGLCHHLHQLFNLDRMIFDPGGGGQWVIGEMHKSRQTIDGIVKTNCTGLCEWSQAAIYPTSQPIIHTFSHGQLWLRDVMDEKFLLTPDGPIEGMHRLALSLIEKRSIVLQPYYLDPTQSIKTPVWPTEITRHWTKSQIQSAKFFDMVYQQLLSIGYEKDKEGNPRTSNNGRLKFGSKQKKDAAYAWLYGLCGIISLINNPDAQEY